MAWQARLSFESWRVVVVVEHSNSGGCLVVWLLELVEL